MTAECLEECDDLILWFSEGKYVYKAMELKMKYKPLTPLQQEKYDSRPGAAKKARRTEPAEEAGRRAVEETDRRGSRSKKRSGDRRRGRQFPCGGRRAGRRDSEDRRSCEEETRPRRRIRGRQSWKKETGGAEAKKHSAITQVVKGATLEEALATGVALASGINIEKEAMEKKEEDLRVTSQMRIDDILQEWEEKQKEHAEAMQSRR